MIGLARPFLAGLALLVLLAGGGQADETRLVDHTGQAVTERDFGPSYRLLYFGYTHCPDACPLGLQVMSDALDRLGRLGDSIAPVFVTVDPERDTPEVLRQYVSMFHPRFRAVSGSEAAIAELAGRYKVVFTKVELGDGRPYAVDHSTSIFLTDATGRVIGRFPHTLTAPELAAKITARLAREP